MATTSRLLAVATSAAVLLGCSSSGDSDATPDPSSSTSPNATVAAVEASESNTEPQTSSTSSTTAAVDVVTTVRRVPSSELSSDGVITIADQEYAFAFECYAAGAGDILALGVGEDPVSGAVTQAIVQAFLGQPYVAVVVGESPVLELAVDEPAQLFVQGDAIRGSALRFVEASESAGVGESLGLGAVTVNCDGFAPGLPPEYDLS